MTKEMTHGLNFSGTKLSEIEGITPGLKSEKKRPFFESLQCWRGIAALAVVCYHVTRLCADSKYFQINFLGGFFSWGMSGVDIFFVLSGFIIYFIHAKDIGRPQRIYNFAKKRLSRVYPAYWVVLLGVLPIYLLAFSTQEIMSAS